MNIDLKVESRNTAKETARKRSGLHLPADDDGGAGEPAAEPRASLEFEDVGGRAIGDDEPEDKEEGECDARHSRGEMMDKTHDVKRMQRLLARENTTGPPVWSIL